MKPIECRIAICMNEEGKWDVAKTAPDAMNWVRDDHEDTQVIGTAFVTVYMTPPVPLSLPNVIIPPTDVEITVAAE